MRFLRSKEIPGRTPIAKKLWPGKTAKFDVNPQINYSEGAALVQPTPLFKETKVRKPHRGRIIILTDDKAAITVYDSDNHAYVESIHSGSNLNNFNLTRKVCYGRLGRLFRRHDRTEHISWSEN